MRFAAVWLIVIGLTSRILPLLDHGGRLLRQFPTEDGYLMMTVARNLALGKGLAIAEGWIPTNGVQPLFTFVQALAFAVVGEDRRHGVVVILMVSIVISLVSMFLMRRIISMITPVERDPESVGSFASALWFSCSLSVCHTMNGLETGLYTTCILATVLFWLKARSGVRSDLSGFHALLLGLMLGITFWARNDAVFLAMAMGISHVAVGCCGDIGVLVRLRRIGIVAAVALIVAAPWPIYNALVFGHPVPMSAASQAVGASLGENLVHVPSLLFEYVSVVLPVPEVYETHPAVLVVATLVCIGFFICVSRAVGCLSPQARSIALASVIFTMLIVISYGLFYGAPWFLSRYLFPISPFMATATVVCIVVAGGRRLDERKRNRLGRAAGVLIIVIVALANLRLYLKGPDNRYMHLVDWVETHVSREEWVGSLQSGTIGFFHDRTVNLDGKVNPQALAARRSGRSAEYSAAGEYGEPPEPIEYIVDWAYIARWIDEPAISDEFIVLIEDREADIAVLARK